MNAKSMKTGAPIMHKHHQANLVWVTMQSQCKTRVSKTQI